ncbi:MAG: hypothetical protein ACE5GZ_08175 [Gammaproteobacteria bacterium]
MLDKFRIGHDFPLFHVVLEKGALRLFARAIGETNPGEQLIKVGLQACTTDGTCLATGEADIILVD